MLRVAAVLAIPLALVVLIPSLFGIWLVNREANERSRANRAIIASIAVASADEREVLVRFVCESIKIRTELDGIEAEAFASRFGAILQDIHRTC